MELGNGLIILMLKLLCEVYCYVYSRFFFIFTAIVYVYVFLHNTLSLTRTLRFVPMNTFRIQWNSTPHSASLSQKSTFKYFI